jgi:myo-inositol-1(or 4)-monophosphatase
VLHNDPTYQPLKEALRQSGEVALTYFGRVRAEKKSDGSHITEADRACEAILVEQLERHFPGTGVIGEEGALQEGSQGTWHVDPIDGTSAFLERLAHWGPTVCLVKDGNVEVGAMWVPLLEDFWFARKGAGAWRNGQRIHAPVIERLQSSDTFYVPSRFHRVSFSGWRGKTRALGSSAVHLAQVAAGHAVATLIAKWNLWDIGCGALLVSESGRHICDRHGEPINLMEHIGEPFLAGDPVALENIVALLHDAAPA